MNILSMTIGRDGCSGYRVKNPLKAINNKGEHQVHFLELGDSEANIETMIKGANVIFFRQQHDQFFHFLKKSGALEGKLAVVDMDDDIFNITPFADTYCWGGVEEVMYEDKWLWKNGQNNFDTERNRKALESIVLMLSKADVVTCTTKYLAKRLKSICYNNNIEVLPNAIDFKHWKPWKLTKEKEVRIGWTGGATHYIDWHTIKEPLIEVFAKNKDLKLVLQGCKWDGITKTLPQEYHDWIDFEGHPYKTASLNLDFAIIPLKDTLFNKSKSCIKWYEFSSLEVPCVVADVAPYNLEIQDGVTGLLYQDDKSFVEQCNRLIKYPELREALAKNARKWVEEHRNLDKIADKYIEVFEKYDPSKS